MYYVCLSGFEKYVGSVQGDRHRQRGGGGGARGRDLFCALVESWCAMRVIDPIYHSRIYEYICPTCVLIYLYIFAREHICVYLEINA